MEDAQPKPVTPEPSPAPSPAPSPVPSPLPDKISLPGANHVEVCCALILILNTKQSDKKSTIYFPEVFLRCVSVHTDVDETSRALRPNFQLFIVILM